MNDANQTRWQAIATDPRFLQAKRARYSVLRRMTALLAVACLLPAIFLFLHDFWLALGVTHGPRGFIEGALPMWLAGVACVSLSAFLQFGRLSKRSDRARLMLAHENSKRRIGRV